MKWTTLLAAARMAGISPAVQAADTIKIGVVSLFSGQTTIE